MRPHRLQQYAAGLHRHGRRADVGREIAAAGPSTRCQRWLPQWHSSCALRLQRAGQSKTVWPSGLRRWLKAPVRKGVGSNPAAVIFHVATAPQVMRAGTATRSLSSPRGCGYKTLAPGAGKRYNAVVGIPHDGSDVAPRAQQRPHDDRRQRSRPARKYSSRVARCALTGCARVRVRTALTAVNHPADGGRHAPLPSAAQAAGCARFSFAHSAATDVLRCVGRD